MTRASSVKYVFIDSAPAQLQPATLYISTKYRAAVHLCLCGCGEKVLLNLDPDGWSFTFDGRFISIHDSVGNVGIPCRSHYIIRKSQVTWLPALKHIDPTVALGPKPRQTDRQASKPRWFSRWLRRRS